MAVGSSSEAASICVRWDIAASFHHTTTFTILAPSTYGSIRLGTRAGALLRPRIRRGPLHNSSRARGASLVPGWLGAAELVRVAGTDASTHRRSGGEWFDSVERSIAPYASASPLSPDGIHKFELLGRVRQPPCSACRRRVEKPSAAWILHPSLHGVAASMYLISAPRGISIRDRQRLRHHDALDQPQLTADGTALLRAPPRRGRDQSVRRWPQGAENIVRGDSAMPPSLRSLRADHAGRGAGAAVRIGLSSSSAGTAHPTELLGAFYELLGEAGKPRHSRTSGSAPSTRSAWRSATSMGSVSHGLYSVRCLASSSASRSRRALHRRDAVYRQGRGPRQRLFRSPRTLRRLGRRESSCATEFTGGDHQRHLGIASQPTPRLIRIEEAHPDFTTKVGETVARDPHDGPS